jgi:dCTP deaminase
MILCDREIEALVHLKIINIDPLPPKQLWTSTAVDLTLDRVLLVWTPQNPPSGDRLPPIAPFSPNFNVPGMMEDPTLAKRIEIDPEQGYVMEPPTSEAPVSFLLGFTRERIHLPHRSRVAARVEGKSSLARLGLGVHVPAPTIHAGFGARAGQSGLPVQLEIFNLGPFRVRLDPGMPIGQIIFEEVRETPSTGYGGQFSEQTFFRAPEDAPSSEED